MTKYHVNPDTGRPNICRAKIKCDFGENTPHFSSKEAAREGYEKQMAEETISDSFSKSPKLPTKNPLDAKIAAAEAEAVKWERAAARGHDTSRGAQALRDRASSARRAADNLKASAKGSDVESSSQANDAKKPLANKKQSPAPKSGLPRLDPTEKSTFIRPAAKKPRLIVPGVPPVSTSAELNEEEGFLREEGLRGFTVKELLRSRDIGPREIMAAETASNGYRLEAKIPSGHEIAVSTDLARKAFGLPPREKTGSDDTPRRAAEIELGDASAGRFGLLSPEQSIAARNRFRAAQIKMMEIMEKEAE